mmetsp:Transcript_57190/g.65478  ORF Transcript_57190/g.65478 Transcript_57190/m.65478 type:complete len:420 (-) Transcript_57190:2466-3725(-)
MHAVHRRAAAPELVVHRPVALWVDHRRPDRHVPADVVALRRNAHAVVLEVVQHVREQRHARRRVAHEDGRVVRAPERAVPHEALARVRPVRQAVHVQRPIVQACLPDALEHHALDAQHAGVRRALHLLLRASVRVRGRAPHSKLPARAVLRVRARRQVPTRDLHLARQHRDLSAHLVRLPVQRLRPRAVVRVVQRRRQRQRQAVRRDRRDRRGLRLVHAIWPERVLRVPRRSRDRHNVPHAPRNGGVQRQRRRARSRRRSQPGVRRLRNRSVRVETPALERQRPVPVEAVLVLNQVAGGPRHVQHVDPHRAVRDRVCRVAQQERAPADQDELRDVDHHRSAHARALVVRHRQRALHRQARERVRHNRGVRVAHAARIPIDARVVPEARAHRSIHRCVRRAVRRVRQTPRLRVAHVSTPT